MTSEDKKVIVFTLEELAKILEDFYKFGNVYIVINYGTNFGDCYFYSDS